MNLHKDAFKNKVLHIMIPTIKNDKQHKKEIVIDKQRNKIPNKKKQTNKQKTNSLKRWNSKSFQQYKGTKHRLFGL